MADNGETGYERFAGETGGNEEEGEVVFEPVDDSEEGEGEELPSLDEQIEVGGEVDVNVDVNVNDGGSGDGDGDDGDDDDSESGEEHGVGFVVGLILMYIVFAVNIGVLVPWPLSWMGAADSPIWSTVFIIIAATVIGGLLENI